MIYSNTSPGAVATLENQRLGDDDYEEETKECPSCGRVDPECFYLSSLTGDCIGCSGCVSQLEWEDF